MREMPKYFTAIILIAGMVIAVFFRGNVIYALIMPGIFYIRCTTLLP